MSQFIKRVYGKTWRGGGGREIRGEKLLLTLYKVAFVTSAAVKS